MRIREVLVLGCAVAFFAVGCKTTKTAPAVKAAEAEAVVTKNYLHLPEPNASLFVTPKDFVRDWLVLGYFSYQPGKYGGDEDQGAAKVAFVPDEAGLVPKEGAVVAGKKWQRYKNDMYDARPELIDLDQFYGAPEYCAAYLGCYVHAPKDLDNLILYVGSDDYVTVWINGKKVHEYSERRRSASPDQDEVKGISLHKGWNRVIVKLVDVVYDWELYLRFADSSGKPIKVTETP